MKSRGWSALSLRMMVALVCVLAGHGSAQNKYNGGLGTAGKPWVIHTPADLAALAADPNDWDDRFLQDRLLEMSGLDPIRPIGTFEQPFTGAYNGGGYTIRNLTILGAAQSQPGGDGLFGVVQGNGTGVTIQKLILENATVLGASTNTGGLIGRIGNGIVQQCGVKGGCVSGTVNTGGLIGQVEADAAVRECYATAHVLGAERVGGLVGLNAGVVADCYSKSNAVAQWGDWPPIGESVNVGGLVGFNFAGWIATSYADCDRVLFRADVTLTPINRGGLVGAWVPGGSAPYVVSGNYSSRDTAGLAATGNNALGTPTSASLTHWSNLVATSVPDAALRQRSTFKGWDFDFTWTMDCDGTPTLKWE